jgi:predicted nucleotidyltransferase
VNDQANHDIPIDRLIVFGGRVRRDYREHSDIDILLVSPAFQGVTCYKRPRSFNTGWDYDELPPPETIALTPAEFEEKRRREPTYRANRDLRRACPSARPSFTTVVSFAR